VEHIATMDQIAQVINTQINTKML